MKTADILIPSKPCWQSHRDLSPEELSKLLQIKYDECYYANYISWSQQVRQFYLQHFETYQIRTLIFKEPNIQEVQDMEILSNSLQLSSQPQLPFLSVMRQHWKVEYHQLAKFCKETSYLLNLGTLIIYAIYHRLDYAETLADLDIPALCLVECLIANDITLTDTLLDNFLFWTDTIFKTLNERQNVSYIHVLDMLIPYLHEILNYINLALTRDEQHNLATVLADRLTVSAKFININTYFFFFCKDFFETQITQLTRYLLPERKQAPDSLQK